MRKMEEGRKGNQFVGDESENFMEDKWEKEGGWAKEDGRKREYI